MLDPNIKQRHLQEMAEERQARARQLAKSNVATPAASRLAQSVAGKAQHTRAGFGPQAPG